MCKGHPGTGKSTLASALAQRLAWPLIDKDDARDCFQQYYTPAGPANSAATVTAAPAVPPPAAAQASPALGPAAHAAAAAAGAAAAAAAPAVDWNQLAYDVMFSFAGRQLSLGMSVVLDCPFARRELYDRVCLLARQHGARVLLVEVTCSDERLWRQRVEQRGLRDRATPRGHKPCSWDELQAVMARYDGCWRWSYEAGAAVGRRVVVDTAVQGLDTCVQAVVQALVPEPGAEC